MKTIILFFALAVNALALDITTTDGSRFTGCSNMIAAGEDLRFMHATGAARVPLLKLPADLQARYFRPEVIATAKDRVRMAEEKRSADVAAAAKAKEDERIAGEERIAAAKQADADAAAERARLLVVKQQEEIQRHADSEARAAAAVIEKQKAAQAAQLAALEKTAESGPVPTTWSGRMWKVWKTPIRIAAVLYFIPCMIGMKKQNRAAIFALNLFLGWTFIGWVIALVWALTKDARSTEPLGHFVGRKSV